MSNTSPIFAMTEPHHFSDYGFDPQICHFQFTEESRRHRKASFKPIDSLHFKLKKPISKDESRRSTARTAKMKKQNKQRWWKSALGFLKNKWAEKSRGGPKEREMGQAVDSLLTGPIYATESTSGCITPYSSYIGTASLGLMKGEMGIPYVSLREGDMGQKQRISASGIPIYLVT